MNEKFLIRLRDCVLKLKEDHPLKRWMKWAAQSGQLQSKEQETQTFLTQIINTQFNLITDRKMKNEIITILHEIPGKTLAEDLLRSYLYLMIGNITHSDNILRKIIQSTPKENWERYERSPSLYHQIATEQIEQIIKKLAKHPADRRTMELFGLFLNRFYNDDAVRELSGDIDTSNIESKLDLRYIEGIAPQFVHFLRLENMSENRRINLLRNTEKFSLEEQAYWVWPFMDVNPLVSDIMAKELIKIEKSDELWFIYLMNNEKLADLVSKNKGSSFLPGRRHYLKTNLKNERAFMMSLYKLIELGDINEELIRSTINFITNE